MRSGRSLLGLLLVSLAVACRAKPAPAPLEGAPDAGALAVETLAWGPDDPRLMRVVESDTGATHTFFGVLRQDGRVERLERVEVRDSAGSLLAEMRFDAEHRPIAWTSSEGARFSLAYLEEGARRLEACSADRSSCEIVSYTEATSQPDTQPSASAPLLDDIPDAGTAGVNVAVESCGGPSTQADVLVSMDWWDTGEARHRSFEAPMTSRPGHYRARVPVFPPLDPGADYGFWRFACQTTAQIYDLVCNFLEQAPDPCRFLPDPRCTRGYRLLKRSCQVFTARGLRGTDNALDAFCAFLDEKFLVDRPPYVPPSSVTFSATARDSLGFGESDRVTRSPARPPYPSLSVAIDAKSVGGTLKLLPERTLFTREDYAARVEIPCAAPGTRVVISVDREANGARTFIQAQEYVLSGSGDQSAQMKVVGPDLPGRDFVQAVITPPPDYVHPGPVPLDASMTFAPRPGTLVVRADANGRYLGTVLGGTSEWTLEVAVSGPDGFLERAMLSGERTSVRFKVPPGNYQAEVVGHHESAMRDYSSVDWNAPGGADAPSSRETWLTFTPVLTEREPSP